MFPYHIYDNNNIILESSVVVDLNRFCLSVLYGPGIDVWTATVVLKMRMVRLVADSKQRGICVEKIFTDVLMAAAAPSPAADKKDKIDIKVNKPDKSRCCVIYCYVCSTSMYIDCGLRAGYRLKHGLLHV